MKVKFVVEKCVYKYRDTVEKTRKKYQELYHEVYELNKQGINNYQISKMLNISPNTVRRYLNKENNPFNEPSYKKILESEHETVLKLYFCENKTQEQIADAMGVSGTTIGSIVNYYKYTNTEVIEEIKKSSTP